MEIRFVQSLLDHGVTWPTIRLAYKNAQSEFGSEYPFATTRLRTDGRSVFADLEREGGARDLLNLVEDGYEMEKIIEQYLEDVEEDPSGLISAWWPKAFNKMIVLDPQRSFGHPIIDVAGIETKILFSAFEAEGGNDSAISQVAKWYEIPDSAVKNAIKFERQLVA